MITGCALKSDPDRYLAFLTLYPYLMASLAGVRLPEVVEASQKDYGALKSKFSTLEKLKEMPLTEVRD